MLRSCSAGSPTAATRSRARVCRTRASITTPEIIRALHCVLQELQTRQTGAQAVNAGRSWRPDEEQQLLEEYDAGLPVEQIALRHGRTAGAIEARLSELGRRDQIQFNMR